MMKVFSVFKYEENMFEDMTNEEIEQACKDWANACDGKTVEELEQMNVEYDDELWSQWMVEVTYDAHQVFKLQQLIWKELTDEQREYWYCVGTIEYTLYVLRLCGVDTDRISQDEFEYAVNMSFDVEKEEESHT